MGQTSYPLPPPLCIMKIKSPPPGTTKDKLSLSGACNEDLERLSVRSTASTTSCVSSMDSSTAPALSGVPGREIISPLASPASKAHKGPIGMCCRESSVDEQAFLPRTSITGEPPSPSRTIQGDVYHSPPPPGNKSMAVNRFSSGGGGVTGSETGAGTGSGTGSGVAAVSTSKSRTASLTTSPAAFEAARRHFSGLNGSGNGSGSGGGNTDESPSESTRATPTTRKDGHRER